MFNTVFFIIVKTWKQPTWPSVGEWINIHPDDGILFSAKKK